MTAAAAEAALQPRRLTERQSFLIVGAAHVLLFAALSLALQSVTPPSPPAEAVAVEIVSEAPAGAPPPAPSPAPKPAPAPPQAAPEAPAPPPQPVAQPVPKPNPEKIAPEVKPDPPKPDKVKPEKAKPDKPVDKPKAKPLDTDALATLLDKRLPKPKSKAFDTTALSKSLDAAQPKTKALDTAALSKSLEAALPKGAPPRAARGTASTSSRGDPRAAAALAAAIRAQVTPCWTLPIGGSGKMTVLLHLDINRDGSVAGRPGVVSQTGVTAANGDYARAFAEAARRAVLRCAPLKLPAEQYDQWKAVEINFDPSSL